MGSDVIHNENSCLEMLGGKFGIRVVWNVEENKLNSGFIRSVCSGNSLVNDYSEDLTHLNCKLMWISEETPVVSKSLPSFFMDSRYHPYSH